MLCALILTEKRKARQKNDFSVGVTRIEKLR